MLKQGFFPMIAVLPASSDLIFDKKPDILLFTVHGLNHIVVLKLAERIKMSAVKRCCRWWCWSNLQAKKPSSGANIDVIVKGEGETVLEHLIPAILNHTDFPRSSVFIDKMDK